MAHTIAALASAPGMAGISVVRLSGDDSHALLRQVFEPASSKDAFKPRYMMYGTLHDGNHPVDECMAVIFSAPNSYTGEDSAEIHLHGSPLIVKECLNLLYRLGAEPAKPGEFTRRAFENGRMDLSRAEAVMQLISAQGELSAKAALRQLRGGTFSFIHNIQKEVIDILSAIEAAIDFPEEVEDSYSPSELASICDDIANRLLKSSDARSAKLLSQGLEVAIVGTPNAGKSSLFNTLLMEDRAIVTETPGTTRDVLRASIVLSGVTVILNDTAGIQDSKDAVEKLGIQRAKREMQTADLLIIVLDGAGPLSREARQILKENTHRSRIVLQSKVDINRTPYYDGALLFSSYTGEGMDEIRSAIIANINGVQDSELTLSRHVDLAKKAAQALTNAKQSFKDGDSPDLCAVHIQDALRLLGEITGDSVSEEVIDSIFSNFCVGK